MSSSCFFSNAFSRNVNAMFLRQTRRQTRSSVANNQPLSPSCSANIIAEPTKTIQTSVQSLKTPVSTTSLGKKENNSQLSLSFTYYFNHDCNNNCNDDLQIVSWC